MYICVYDVYVCSVNVCSIYVCVVWYVYVWYLYGVRVRVCVCRPETDTGCPVVLSILISGKAFH